MTPPLPDSSPDSEEKAMRNRRLRILLACLVTLAAVLAVVAAAAQSRRWRPRPPPPAPSFSVSLEAEDGVPFQTFRQGGTTWVQGEDGERYVIVVRNPTGERVEAVVSVDGRDAITGRVANMRTSRGYVLQPFGSVRIEGFRQSLDQVATFRFSPPGESYSSRMGTPQNVGVIGVAFFRERVEPPPVAFEEREWRRRPPFPRPSAPSRKSAASGGARPPRAAAQPQESDSNLGTEYGESRDSRVVEVQFERQSNTPIRVVTLRYDDAEGLEARGINVFERPRPRPRPFPPQPFSDTGFAPPPP